MISPEDPRHGTIAGYRAGCRSDRCALAWFRYNKRRKILVARGEELKVPALGFQRRVRALQAMGWPQSAITAEMGGRVQGLDPERDLLVLKATHQRMVDVYDRLSMTPGPSNSARIRAKAKGWAPPLAWTNIDDPNEQPDLGAEDPDILDEVLIQRAMSGQPVPNATTSERLEIIRRWRATGRPLNDLDRVQPWNVRRELRKAA